MTQDNSEFFSSNAKDGESDRSFSPLQALGWQPYFAEQISAAELNETPPVRIVEVHRNAFHVIGDGIDELVPTQQDATVGDWLLLDNTLLQAARVLDRQSLLKRRAPGADRHVQLIAANIDTAFIVTSCNRDFNIARLERYIVMVLDAQITPVVILTKSDLVPDPQRFVDETRAVSDLASVVVLDARGAEPGEKLAEWCKPGKTVAFLGSSGVGKSTLTNALAGTQSIETQAIREEDARGRHTTTSRQLHLMPGGCLVLDTPGMRELQLTDAAFGIDEVFADLQTLTTQCRFRDCKHEVEPGCAVLAALTNGEIDMARVGRWRKLSTEEASNSADLVKRRAKDKAFGKMVKRTKKAKSRRNWDSD